MLYFKFKDVDSREIEGLVVCELPPITKPAKRVELIDIEGKNGDIIVDNGYSAYDKEIKIGLTRNYDLQAIVQWLDGKGKLILSNEEDYYYEAEVIEQIDFMRLVKFKTANVRFHVQPIKYLNFEPKRVITKEDIDNNVIENLRIRNQGYMDCSPIFTLYGSGECSLYIDNVQCCSVDIDDKFVVLDGIEQEAYKGNVLKNTRMNGEFPILKAGENMVKVTGEGFEKVEIQVMSKFL